jgi:hypothetical protein
VSSSLKITHRHRNSQRGMEQRRAIFILFLASIFTLAHSFSANSLQIKTIPTTTIRKTNRVQKVHTNLVGPGLGSRHKGYSQIHGRRIHTSLASDVALDYYDPYVTANKIEPKTQTISESLIFYARFLVDHFGKRPPKIVESGDANNLIRRLLRKNTNSKENSIWRKMNEQRKNIMTLAGYTTSFVVPSFGFLLLGALMTSIVPSYWGKCIQCVATLTATKAQLVEALVGLGVSSLLAGLFTGIRGSLFWIGGKWRIYMRVWIFVSITLNQFEKMIVLFLLLAP